MKAYELYKDLELTDKSEHTVRSYTKNIGDFLAHFEIETPEQLSALSLVDLKAYQQKLAENLSPNSVNQKFASLKAFVKFLLEAEIIESSKINLVKNVKAKKKLVFTLKKEDVIAMLDACKTTDERLMLLLMVTTGLRRAEVANIKLEDIDGCNLRIVGKGDKPANVPLTDEVCELMSAYVSARKHDSEYLFIGKGTHDGITGEAIAYRVKKIARDAGLPEEVLAQVTPHTLRKTFVTDIAREYGVGAAQAAARHASLQTTTQCYINSDELLPKEQMRKTTWL